MTTDAYLLLLQQRIDEVNDANTPSLTKRQIKMKNQALVTAAYDNGYSSDILNLLAKFYYLQDAIASTCGTYLLEEVIFLLEVEKNRKVKKASAAISFQ